jgi:hypothetical protein
MATAQASGMDAMRAAHVDRAYINGGLVGENCSPEIIRHVLLESNLFLNSEIEKWPSDGHILVPIGSSFTIWIIDEANTVD